MVQPILRSIQIGLPQEMGQPGATEPMDRPWRSGIFKSPVEGPVWLGQTNLVGDGQGDLVHHGGPEKAVLVYAAAHYPAWREELGLPEMAYGGFGENFTVDCITEADLCIGDTYTVGEALVQVSQPRQPCWKLARRWRRKDLALRTQTSGRTGWYLRVLAEGHVQAGDLFELVARPVPQWSVARANHLMHVAREDLAGAAELAACPYLAPNWRQTLSNRAIDGPKPDQARRLVGPNAP